MAEGGDKRKWSNQGIVVRDWSGHDNRAWPRNLTAPRYELPQFPGEECSDGEWAEYESNWNEWEGLVRKRWEWVSKTEAYKNKKVSRFNSFMSASFLFESIENYLQTCSGGRTGRRCL